MAAKTKLAIIDVPPPSGYRGAIFFWLLALGALLLIACTYLDYNAQLYLSLGLLALIFILKFNRDGKVNRVIFLTIASFIVLRYLAWRTFTTLEFADWVSFSCALVLYMAEFYGILVFMLGNFVNAHPVDRESPELSVYEELPTVDVYIPSYNEGLEILEVTVTAALQMRYPKEKLNVFLLDDGGTDQKCNSGTKETMKQAQERRSNLQRLCETLGAIYMTRERNEHAKAGNLNAAFHRTDGDLIVIFDADHVPTEDFLEQTVGYFAIDPKLFLVQTPHFFVNPDPIEKNLETFHRMPSENEMFYRVIQRGLDFWNSSFFCGSGAVMSRTALEVTGGLSGDTITEDAETALTLHSKGFNSVYVSKPLLSGLAPETMGGFITQRIRWAQGMVQIFLLKCPLFLRGLTFPQRLCYFNSCFFWFFPFARIVYLLAPIAFLLFGLKIYAATWQTFLAYAVPHLLTVITVSSYLYGRVRWSFVSELYELMQSVYTVPAIFSTFLKPKAPTFKVTPKGEQLDKTYISPLVHPFYIFTFINLLALGFGAYRFIKEPVMDYPTAITMFWSFFNTVILLAALGAMLERRQRRATPRMPANVEAELICGDKTFDCRIMDMSLGGCRMLVQAYAERAIEAQAGGILKVFMGSEEEKVEWNFNIDFKNVRRDIGAEGLVVGAQFNHQSLEERKAKVRLVSGNSERWMEFQKLREGRLGVLGSFICLLYLGIKHSLQHFYHLLGHFIGVVTGQSRKVETRTMGGARG